MADESLAFDVEKCDVAAIARIPPCENLLVDPRVTEAPPTIPDCPDETPFLPPEPAAIAVGPTSPTKSYFEIRGSQGYVEWSFAKAGCDEELDIAVDTPFFVSDGAGQGFQGFQGHTGVQGFPGARGNQGFSGTPGAQGYAGTPGGAGAQGSSGAQGASGGCTGSGTEVRITSVTCSPPAAHGVTCTNRMRFYYAVKYLPTCTDILTYYEDLCCCAEGCYESSSVSGSASDSSSVSFPPPGPLDVTLAGTCCETPIMLPGTFIAEIYNVSGPETNFPDRILAEYQGSGTWYGGVAYTPVHPNCFQSLFGVQIYAECVGPDEWRLVLFFAYPGEGSQVPLCPKTVTTTPISPWITPPCPECPGNGGGSSSVVQYFTCGQYPANNSHAKTMTFVTPYGTVSYDVRISW